MATLIRSTPLVHFDRFELDLRSGELKFDGRKQRLPGQPAQLLVFLVSRAGELVTREELRSKLWPEGTFVGFDHAVNNAVNRVRDALRDSASAPKYIETIPKRGYRFIGTLETERSVTPAPIEVVSSAGRSVSSSVWRYLTRPLVGISVVALITAAWFGVLSKSHRGSGPQLPIHSLLVLPFANLSGDPAQDYLADGITDELITDLAGFDSLRVISRTSAVAVRDVRKPLKTIARELDVDAVVEGSISRSGNRVRVRAQLIDARTDQHRWAQSYERDITDVFELESDLAKQLSEQVSLHLSASKKLASSPIRPRTPEAYEDYLKGWYFFDKRNPEASKRSVEYFRKSIAQDAKFALAYVGLAEALETLSAMDVAAYSRTEPEALQSLGQALQLDPDLGEAHSALGLLEAQWNWNWAEAERQLKLGLKFSPGSAIVHDRYAIYLQAVGQTEEAVREAKRALELDPLSFFMNRELARAQYLARRYDEAIQQLHRAAELDPHASVVKNWLSWIAEKKGDHVRAMELILLNAPLEGWSEDVTRPFRQAYEARDWRRFCEADLRLLAKTGNVSASYFAGVDEARLGNKDAAFDWLERSLNGKTVWVMWIKVDPLLDDLRSDPRFNDLVRRMGLDI